MKRKGGEGQIKGERESEKGGRKVRFERGRQIGHVIMINGWEESGYLSLFLDYHQWM